MDDETVMMSIEQGEYYGINPVGSRIWELLVQPRTVPALIDILMQEYNAPLEECQQDVLEFLNKLLEKKLVKVVSEA
jgi:hypothetical protein